MAGSHFADAVRQMLSPTMTARGFGPGGPGISPDGSVTFLYCTGAQSFAARWPETTEVLGTKTYVDLEEPSRCLDLVVEVSPTGEIVRLDFEFVELDVLLHAADLDDLAQGCSAERLREIGAVDAVGTLVEAVEALMPLGPGK